MIIRKMDFIGDGTEGMQLIFGERMPGLAGVINRKLGTVTVASQDDKTENICYFVKLSKPDQDNDNEYFQLTGDGTLSNIVPLSEDEQYTVGIEYGIAGGRVNKEKLYIRCRGVEQPFYSGDAIGTVQYRIPALITMQDGRLMAAIDARFGPDDSPDNLETAVRIFDTVSGKWGKSVLVNNFLDYPNVPSGKIPGSASFIDAQLLQTSSGRIILMTDAYPYAGGIHGGNSLPGNGLVVVKGEQFIGLTEQVYSAQTDGAFCAIEEFEYYIDKQNKIRKRSDNTITSYSVNEEYQLQKDGELLYCEQFGTSDMVPMSIFYERSRFHIFKSSYLWMRHSDDMGRTWSPPCILADVKKKEEPFLGMGPGKGLQLKNGSFAGRILFAVYDNTNGERSSIIYSDDGGVTWKRGQRTCMGTSGLGKTSESQMVELPDGTLRLFCRTQSRPGHIGYCDSMDGGVTWTDMVKDQVLSYCGNNQISVINYSKEVDGSPVVLISYAMTNGEAPAIRSDGVIRTGRITQNPEGQGTERYFITWSEPYLYQPGRHDYSCISEMSNGDIAIFHENLMDSPVAGENVVFRIISGRELKLKHG